MTTTRNKTTHKHSSRTPHRNLKIYQHESHQKWLLISGVAKKWPVHERSPPLPSLISYKLHRYWSIKRSNAAALQNVMTNIFTSIRYISTFNSNSLIWHSHTLSHAWHIIESSLLIEYLKITATFFGELRWKVFFRFVDVVEIIDIHCLRFLFICTYICTSGY